MEITKDSVVYQTAYQATSDALANTFTTGIHLGESQVITAPATYTLNTPRYGVFIQNLSTTTALTFTINSDTFEWTVPVGGWVPFLIDVPIISITTTIAGTANLCPFN